MWRLLFLLALAGCAPADQESVRTVAAVEVVLKEPGDRADLVAILRQNAAESGLHVDDVSDRWRSLEGKATEIPAADRTTFAVGVWLGEKGGEPVVQANDGFHPGRVWVEFLRGAEPARFKSYRDATLAEIRQRWPEARPLPILPWGGLPLAKDLVLTAQGYRISRSAAADYELSPSLPIFAADQGSR